MYMSSQCTNDGNYTLTVTFKPGTDLNISQVLVQNRESLAEPILPDLVKRRGISVKKKSPNVLMIVNLFSTDDSRDQPRAEQLRHHPDPRRAVAPAGRRRHHLPRPARLQHAAVARPAEAGVLQPQRPGRDQRRAGAEHPGGGRPDRPAADADRPGVQYIITTLGRLENTDQFANIVLKNNNGTLVYLQRRGQHRAGRPVLRPDLHARRQAVGGPVGLPAARLQRPGGRPARQGADEAAQGALPARHRLRHRLRHHAVHQRVDQRGLRDAVRRRSCWWPSWCWCSCRTGGRR